LGQCAIEVEGECELSEDGSIDSGEAQLRRQTELLISALQSRMADADAAASASVLRLEAAEAAESKAKEAAARATSSLLHAEDFLQEKIRYLDGLISRLRKQGKSDLELIGETLKALRLAELDASRSRSRALEELGLQPVHDGMRLRQGTYLSQVVEGKDKALTIMDAVVMDEASPADPSVKVSVDGMPPSYVPRAELAIWTCGAADDFDSELGMWGSQ